MTESMIERMARAAFNAHSRRGEDHWENADPIQRETKIREMTAALRAMREPTARMIAAGAMGSGEDSETVASSAWAAMIDAALQWPPGSADRAGVPLAKD